MPRRKPPIDYSAYSALLDTIPEGAILSRAAKIMSSRRKTTPGGAPIRNHTPKAQRLRETRRRYRARKKGMSEQPLMNYQATIQNMTESRCYGRIINDAVCDHKHRTELAAERCSTRLWHQYFGERHDPSNRNYRPGTQPVDNEST